MSEQVTEQDIVSKVRIMANGGWDVCFAKELKSIPVYTLILKDAMNHDRYVKMIHHDLDDMYQQIQNVERAM